MRQVPKHWGRRAAAACLALALCLGLLPAPARAVGEETGFPSFTVKYNYTTIYQGILPVRAERIEKTVHYSIPAPGYDEVQTYFRLKSLDTETGEETYVTGEAQEHSPYPITVTRADGAVLYEGKGSFEGFNAAAESFEGLMTWAQAQAYCARLAAEKAEAEREAALTGDHQEIVVEVGASQGDKYPKKQVYRGVYPVRVERYGAWVGSGALQDYVDHFYLYTIDPTTGAEKKLTEGARDDGGGVYSSSRITVTRADGTVLYEGAPVEYNDASDKFEGVLLWQYAAEYYQRRGAETLKTALSALATYVKDGPAAVTGQTRPATRYLGDAPYWQNADGVTTVRYDAATGTYTSAHGWFRGKLDELSAETLRAEIDAIAAVSEFIEIDGYADAQADVMDWWQTLSEAFLRAQLRENSVTYRATPAAGEPAYNETDATYTAPNGWFQGKLEDMTSEALKAEAEALNAAKTAYSSSVFQYTRPSSAQADEWARLAAQYGRTVSKAAEALLADVDSWVEVLNNRANNNYYTIPSGWYALAPASAPNMRLTVNGSRTGANIDVRSAQTGDAAMYQMFYFEKKSDGWYHVTTGNGALGTESKASGDGYNVYQAERMELDASYDYARQHWRLVRAGGDSFYLHQRFNQDMYLEVESGGSNARIAPITGQANQKWKLYQMSYDGAEGDAYVPIGEADASSGVWLSEAGPTEGGVAVKNTYLFEVTTGSITNDSFGGIEFFNLHYTDAAGVKRMELIFPGENSLKKSLTAAANAGNTDEKEQLIQDTFGYRLTTPLTDVAPLRRQGTDQFLFETPAAIRTIDQIQVFGKRSTAESQWICQGMRVYRVDTLYGLRMYGYYSAAPFIDYAGALICNVAISRGAGYFTWANSGGMYNIGGGSAAPGYTIEMVDVAKPRQSEVNFALRFDLGDAAGAGLECLAMQTDEGRHAIGEMGLCEAATLNIKYQDIYGGTRDVKLPLVLNALGWAIGMEGGGLELAGYAQQGDTVMVAGVLPDLEAVTQVHMTIGGTAAREACGLTAADGSLGSAARTRRAARERLSDAETLNCVSAALYLEGYISVKRSGVALTYGFGGDPYSYQTSGSTEGAALRAGERATFTLSRWQEGAALAPTDRQERYLITLRTDSVPNAGTTADIQMKLFYTDMNDRSNETAEFSIRPYVEQFYGYWPGSTARFAYDYGLRAGGEVQFLLPLNNVKAFTGVQLRLADGSDDDWQMTYLSIAMVTSYEKRRGVWEELRADGLVSHVRYARQVQAMEECYTANFSVQPLLIQEGTIQDIGGNGRDVSAREEADWTQYRYQMTYAEASQNFHFAKARCTYQIDVKVAGDKNTDAADGDCGSKNLFYFRLLFKNGSSCYVLANQQMTSDGFRTNMLETFYISTAQDYGDVTAVQIIPDDVSGQSDTFDKLKIQYIEVTKQTTAALAPVWRVGGESENEQENDSLALGWIGIDFRDEGSKTTVRGQSGRSFADMAHTFTFNAASYSARLIVSVDTGAYDANDPVMVGGLEMSYRYYTASGLEEQTVGDVVKLMYDYAGRGVSAPAGGYVKSDAQLQFRGGTSNRFALSVSNLTRLVDMTFYTKSDVATVWHVPKVKVYLQNSAGTPYFNTKGEYDYIYPMGGEPTLIAESDSSEGYSQAIGIYEKTAHGEEMNKNTVQVFFQGEEIALSPDVGDWNTTVTREPASDNSTLNLFVYPEQGGAEGGVTNPDRYDMIGAVSYNAYEKPVQVSAGRMDKTTDGDGNTVFYATGLTASGMDSFNGALVRADAVSALYVPIDHAVVQQVKEGVLMSTWRVTGGGNAEYTVALDRTETWNTGTQRVLLRLADDAASVRLEKESLDGDGNRVTGKDVAVALHYTCNEPSGTEYRSRYVYLTDQGYDEIKSGDLIELSFSLTNLKEITGMTLVSVGATETHVACAYVADLDASGALKRSYGFAAGSAVGASPRRLAPNGDVELLDMTFETAADDAALAERSIRMKVVYYDSLGRAASEEVSDLHACLTEGGGFAAGGVDRVRLLVAGLSELRRVELEPRHGGTGNNAERASWALDALTVTVGAGGRSVRRAVDATIVEGSPLAINLANILLSATLYIVDGGEPEETGEVMQTGGSASKLLKPGQALYIAPRVSGSGEGYAVTVQLYDPVTQATGVSGAAALADTRGYTAEKLREYRDAAAGENERDVWESITPENGSLEDSGMVVRFTPPNNYTGADLYYRLTVSAKEDAAAKVTIDVTVKAQEDASARRLEAARAEDAS